MGTEDVSSGLVEFEGYWQRERDRIYRALALALGDPMLASEAVDEGMTRTLARWPTVGRYRNPAGWTYRVAFNWATSWRRKLALRPTRSAEQLDGATTDELPDVDLAAELAQLRPIQRSALIMRFYLQFTPTEIAEALDLPVGTIKSHLHRGLQRLRPTVEEASS